MILQASLPMPARRAEHLARWKLRVIEADTSSRAYNDIIGMRSELCEKYGFPRAWAADKVDDYSTLYCAYADDRPVGTIRVTRAADGKLTYEDFYPARLLADFRDRIGSGARFIVRQDLPPGMQIARVLIETAWLDQFRRGIRLDIIDAHPRALRYYERLGYRLIAGSHFVNPRAGWPSYVMVYAATDRQGGPLRHLFEGLEDPISAETLERYVKFTTVADRETPTGPTRT